MQYRSRRPRLLGWSKYLENNCQEWRLEAAGLMGHGRSSTKELVVTLSTKEPTGQSLLHWERFSAAQNQDGSSRSFLLP